MDVELLMERYDVFMYVSNYDFTLLIIVV